LMNVDI